MKKLIDNVARALARYRTSGVEVRTFTENLSGNEHRKSLTTAVSINTSPGAWELVRRSRLMVNYTYACDPLQSLVAPELQECIHKITKKSD